MSCKRHCRAGHLGHAFALAALLAACRGQDAGHDHASEHPAGHDHHDEGHGHGDGPVVRITRWSCSPSTRPRSPDRRSTSWPT